MSPRTPTLPPTEPTMWRKLLARTHPDAGGDPSHVSFGIRGLGYRLERLPEHDNELFVLPAREQTKEPDRATAATVIDLPSWEKPDALEPSRERPTESPAKRAPKVDGVFLHGPLCECDWCEDELEPSYARPVRAKA